MNKKNKHKKGYNFDELCKVYPDLLPFVIQTKQAKSSIDFSDPKAVKTLNTALLFKHYDIKYWQFSDNHLCPAVPGRADYIHYLKDLIQDQTKAIKILDIGTGASCIYPILGNSIYKWKFVGTDISKQSIEQAQKIIKVNKLSKDIELRLQTHKEQIFKGVINSSDIFTASMCNPPFYASMEEANAATTRKLSGLGDENTSSNKPKRNFSGKENELWYKGGEKAFLHNYLYESSFYKEQVEWFTILVSNKKLIKSMYDSLEKLNATVIKTIPMQHGNKIMRIVAWKF